MMAISRPEWLKVKLPNADKMQEMKALMDGLKLHTVCESAQCPNTGECFENCTATFMIMGETCTRNCTFCAVHHGTPELLDREEPYMLAAAAVKLRLKHIVITSVTRDDLPDGGAAHFAAVVTAVRQQVPAASIEVLIPDLQGNNQALAVIVGAHPHVLNHNIETVPRLYPLVRPQADYERSIQLFKHVRRMAPTMIIKSGFMLGLGEEQAEILAVMEDLSYAGCNILTIGQYLRPSDKHIPLVRYIPPTEFEYYANQGRKMGFAVVAANPLVRSSYYAREAYQDAASKIIKK